MVPQTQIAEKHMQLYQCWFNAAQVSQSMGNTIRGNVMMVHMSRLPVILDFDHFGPGDFVRLSVISDGDFGRCVVKSDIYLYTI